MSDRLAGSIEELEGIAIGLMWSAGNALSEAVRLLADAGVHDKAKAIDDVLVQLNQVMRTVSGLEPS